MSSILKALKKLESEKTGHIPDSLKIDSDILVQDSPRHLSAFSILFLCLLVFGGGALVAVFFMKEPKNPQTLPVFPPVATQKNVILPVVPLVTKSENPPDEIIVVPAVKTSPDKRVRSQQPSAPVAGKVTTYPADIKQIQAAPILSEKPSLVPEIPKTTKPVLPPSGSLPTLRINGIAFQTNESDSMAIVNGTPVSRGSKIEGVTVAEIQKDRVLFERNGEKFEIQLGQSNK